MRIQKHITFFVILTGIMTSTAFSQTVCVPEKMKTIKELILPDISHNAAFIENLFRDIEAGKLKCQIQTKNMGNGYSWGTCGYSYPEAVHQISVSGKNQTWNLTIREDSVECSPKGAYWLTDISTKLNSVKSMIQDDDRLLVQIRTPRCAQTDIFQSVIYSYQNSNSDKVSTKLAIIDSSDSQDSCQEQKNSGILELSLQKLGLDPKIFN